MQYQVPHFLETEQRIWGPFTFNTFVILIGVGGVLAIIYFTQIVGYITWIIISVVAVLITLALMFGSYNGRGLYLVISDFFFHLVKDRRHTWEGAEIKEKVSDFLVIKPELQNLPNIGAVKKKEEKPLGQRVEEISKLLDQ